VRNPGYALDPKTRTLRTEIDLPNPDGTLHPGLYAYTTVIVEEHPDVLTLPATAVVRDGEKTFCVAVRVGRAARRPIEVGLSDGARTEIRSGLKGDEVVVKANAVSLTDGQPVEPIKSANLSTSGSKP
jgi:multidrug efflux pump subunit AcrA (membrane-fusion protein)